MATKQIIKSAKSPAAVGPYNHAVRVGDPKNRLLA
jgi:hypothetical protein